MSARASEKTNDAPGSLTGVRRMDLLALGVFMLALCARLVHIWTLRESPFFTQLFVDSVDFDARALAFIQGGWAEEGAFYQAPFYPLFLSFLYRIFGHSLLAVRLVQALLGSGTALLVYLVGLRCCGRRVGLVAGLTAALYSMAIHFDTEILRPALAVFLAVLCLHLLLSASEKGGSGRWAAAGFILGLAAITRPTLLIFMPAAALWIYFRRGRRLGSKAAAAAIFVCCALVPVGTVTSVNYARSGQFVLISYNGGINFFIGNNAEYDRTVGIRPGIRWDILTSEPAADRRTDPAGWSRHYYNTSFDYILSNPSGYAALLLKKFVLFWNGHEIERNVDFSHVAAYSPFMAYKLVSFRWVAPLALVGMALAWRKKAPMGLLGLYFISQMIAVVAFFVCSRYRMIAMPPLWIFAAYGAVVTTGMLKKRWVDAAPYLGLIALAAVGVNSNPYSISQTGYARPDYELALVSRREGRVEECLAFLRKAGAERPDDPDPLFQQGVTLAGSGRYADAASAFEEAARLEPRYPLSWFNLGLCLGRVGRHVEAAEAYNRAIEIDSSYWEARMGLGGALEQAGRLEDAAEAFRRAERIARDRRGAALSRMSLGRVEGEAGRYETSLEHLDAAISMDPGLLEASLARARVLMSMGRPAMAEKEAERAARLAPSDARVRALLEELGR